MNKFYIRSLIPLLFVVLGSANLMAQSATIAGTVKDATGETLAGVNILVKGRVVGTITDVKGQYNLKVNQAPPFTLVFSFIGFTTQEIEIKDENTASLDLSMEEQTLLGQEVVVSASRIEESILKSPVTIEKMDILGIKTAATPDFYDALANMKGVQVTSGSMNFTAVNTRGFATIANERFVQWVDGMDTQAPLLNFPTGNIIGIGELDAESIELVPGAASALYGPNAFNGIMLMKSKSPFDYQGLSGQIKVGQVSSKAAGTAPLTQYAIRYAKSFNNKFAFKVNFSYLKSTDWLGSDLKTDRNRSTSTVDLSGKQNFDGLNTYGDETPIPVPIGGTFGTLDLRRTGYSEADLLRASGDNRDVKSIKGDLALHYRINDKIEVLYQYRYGGGSSVYQGTEKYALRDFTQQFHKIEVRGDNFFLRAYQTATDAGKSYNLSALGGFLNETISPTAAQWAPLYAQTYVLGMQGYIPGVAAGNQDQAYAQARATADATRPAPGTPAFNDLVAKVRGNYFQKVPNGAAGGASFIDNSKLLHVEGNYKFFKQITWAEIMVGGNFRRYDLFSNGTVFNEGKATTDASGNPVLDATGKPVVTFKGITIDEYGMYAQIAKTLAEKLKLTGSIRYDKNQNFNGQVTPRISAVYELSKNNNLRASIQTGFRNPASQSQFIYFPSSGGTLIGSVKQNAEQYGIHNGGAWTKSSYDAYRASGGSLDPNTGAFVGGNSSLLTTANLAYVQPEQLTAMEIGFKGLIASKILVDLNGYYTTYSNFLGGLVVVASKLPTIQQGVQVNAGQLWAPYTNSTQDISSFGMGLGLGYNLPRNFSLSGNYSYANYVAAESPDFKAGFNTPKNKFSVGLSNRKIGKNAGFSVNYRYQSAFEWQSSYGIWQVPEFGVLDAQVSYKVQTIKTMVKIGGTNLGGGDYRTNFGAPYVGQQYYISLTFDEFLK